MSTKLERNYTAVPNVIFDEAMRTLKPGAVKVLLAICRYTYGWQKESDRISLKDLVNMTGMVKGSVVRSIKDLGALITHSAGDPTQSLASEYRINISNNKILHAELVSKRDQGLVSKRDQASLLASLIKRPSKETKKKKNPDARARESRNKTTSLSKTGNRPSENIAEVKQLVAQVLKNQEPQPSDDEASKYLRMMANTGIYSPEQIQALAGKSLMQLQRLHSELERHKHKILRARGFTTVSDDPEKYRQ